MLLLWGKAEPQIMDRVVLLSKDCRFPYPTNQYGRELDKVYGGQLL